MVDCLNFHAIKRGNENILADARWITSSNKLLKSRRILYQQSINPKILIKPHRLINPPVQDWRLILEGVGGGGEEEKGVELKLRGVSSIQGGIVVLGESPAQRSASNSLFMPSCTLEKRPLPGLAQEAGSTPLQFEKEGLVKVGLEKQ